jgi:hypothetical protein
MIHDRQRLPLRFEAGDDLVSVHPRLDHFEGHAAANRLGLLGHEHDAKAPFADLLQQLVRADLNAGAFGRLVGRRRCGVAIHDHWSGDPLLIEQAIGLVVNSQQRLDVPPQFGIVTASLAQVAGADRRIGLF